MKATAAELAQRLLAEDLDALGEEERRVLANIAAGQPTSRDPTLVAAEHATRGERLADRVAGIGGSWGFIIAFALVLLAWMFLNAGLLDHFGLAFDPYPFIFLNLMLSTLAAIQAPIIMMSQNRQAAKDRLAAKLDYETNLRAELEILRLHEKLDQRVIARLDRLEQALAAMVEKPAKPD